MDLYISPLSCSLAVHIACIEAEIAPAIHRVDRKSKRLDDGRDFRAISPQTNVPVISLSDGSLLTESSAILQYIADQAPAKHLAPPAGSLERYRLMEWLNFVTSELHKKHAWMIFSSKTSPEMKAWGREHAPTALDYVARHLENREYLVGEHFTVADAYMFWALFVLPHGGVSLENYPALRTYVERIRARRSVAQALAFEAPQYAREAAANGLPLPTTAV